MNLRHLTLLFPSVRPGYVQGMSDLLSPLLFVTQNEVESFWCLTGFMELVVSRNIYLCLWNSVTNKVQFGSCVCIHSSHRRTGREQQHRAKQSLNADLIVPASCGQFNDSSVVTWCFISCSDLNEKRKRTLFKSQQFYCSSDVFRFDLLLRFRVEYMCINSRILKVTNLSSFPLQHQNFEESQEAMKQQLLQLSILLKALDPELCDFLG